jgi:hypothetical protein
LRASGSADTLFSDMDAIPSAVQSALELFDDAFADLRFADIDAKTLARSAAEVNELAAVVASAQASLDGAQRALAEKQGALLEQVQRAVAYARVYAENDEALRAKLGAIRLPRATRSARADEAPPFVLSEEPRPTPARRGRPRKAPVTEQLHVAVPPAAASGSVANDETAQMETAPVAPRKLG